MVRQEVRRKATRAAILKAARTRFGRRGYENSTVDDIALGAGVAKGAVYHHFPTKKALFEAVLETVSEELAAHVLETASKETDVLDAMAKAIRVYFERCADSVNAKIILEDGPAVLGWERWREIDVRHFGGGVPIALQAAIDAGTIRKQPVEPLARLFLGAMTEAAVACASRSDFSIAANEYATAFEALLEALRHTK